jgi:predicted nucleic acid-binding protein
MKPSSTNMTETKTLVIFDCNVWLDFLSGNEDLEKKVVDEGWPVLVSSYVAVEVIRALHHVAKALKTKFSVLESNFWYFSMLPTIIKDFKMPFTTGLIDEIKNMPEFRVIAKLLDLETKDIPYIVEAYQHEACIVTRDNRSLLTKKEEIKSKLGVILISEEEFLVQDRSE